MWGKVESEQLSRRVGAELGLDVKIVRPGALVDYSEFEPPGRLGKRVGNLFVAVGSSRDRLGIVDVGFAAAVLAWIADHFDETAGSLNLIAPELPTKRELLDRLRKANPGLRVIWLPRAVLVPVSGLALALQKLLHPRRTGINLARVFAVQAYDTTGISRLVSQMSEAR